MRTTLNINDRLMAEAKVRAVRERTTLTRLVEEGLRLRLRPPAPTGKVTIDLPVSPPGRMNPGINPLSNKSLLGEGDD